MQAIRDTGDTGEGHSEQIATARIIKIMPFLIQGKKALQSQQYADAINILRQGLVNWIVSNVDPQFVLAENTTIKQMNYQITKALQQACLINLSKNNFVKAMIQYVI